METFKKRQKEMLRKDRQRDKAAKRVEKKLQRANGTAPPLDEFGNPIETEPAVVEDTVAEP
jgi:hypothetical protein